MSRPPPPFTPPPADIPAAATPDWVPDGLEALSRADPLLIDALARRGPLPWHRRARGFPGLLRTICGQQISDRAAGAIWDRLRGIPGALDPAGLLALDEALLRGVAGLSRPKVAHARALAAAILEGRLRLDRLPALPDEEAIAHLAAVRGLGRWTAQLHLLLAEDRPDIFPEGDLALAASFTALRGLPARPAPRSLAEAALVWRPYRSLAARLLWHRGAGPAGSPPAPGRPFRESPAQ